MRVVSELRGTRSLLIVSMFLWAIIPLVGSTSSTVPSATIDDCSSFKEVLDVRPIDHATLADMYDYDY